MDRNRLQTPIKIQAAARAQPATYVVFDQLYADHRPIMREPLARRRASLLDAVHGLQGPRLAVSEGLVGQGKALIDACVPRGLEGMVAKRLDSRYVAGRRTGAWLKTIHRRRLQCAIIGFVPTDGGSFEVLILATESADRIVPCGLVELGFTTDTRREICGMQLIEVRMGGRV